MSDTPTSDNYSSEPQLDLVECPYCGNATMPNLLADGSYICSCPSERALPPPDATSVAMPPPVDDSSFVASTHEKPARLPGNQGQFGRDIQTDDYKLLRDPPGASPSENGSPGVSAGA